MRTKPLTKPTVLFAYKIFDFVRPANLRFAGVAQPMAVHPTRGHNQAAAYKPYAYKSEAFVRKP